MQVLCVITLRNTVLTDDVEAAILAVKNESFKQTREDDFFRTLIYGVIKNRTMIDETISTFAPRWKIKDLPTVDRAILEIGLYEIMLTDTPSAIVINEAVEIAKEFGDKSSASFVNGVLASQVKADES